MDPFGLRSRHLWSSPCQTVSKKENITIWKGSTIKRPKCMHREDDLKHQWNEKIFTHSEPDTVGSLLHPFCKKTFTEHLLCTWPCSTRGYKNESNCASFRFMCLSYSLSGALMAWKRKWSFQKCHSSWEKWTQVARMPMPHGTDRQGEAAPSFPRLQAQASRGLPLRSLSQRA